MRLHFEEGERDILTARLGLDEKATDKDLAAAVAEWMKEDPPAPEVEDDDDEVTAPPKKAGKKAVAKVEDEEDDDVLDIEAGADDVVVVDVAEFKRLRKRDRVAATVEAAAAIRDRDELIEEAIHDGKFSASRREHYKGRYDSDPEGTTKLIARLTKNTVPIEELGGNTPDDEVEASAYPQEWVPEVAARQSRTSKSRVHGED